MKIPDFVGQIFGSDINYFNNQESDTLISNETSGYGSLHVIDILLDEKKKTLSQNPLDLQMSKKHEQIRNFKSNSLK